MRQLEDNYLSLIQATVNKVIGCILILFPNRNWLQNVYIGNQLNKCKYSIDVILNQI